MRTTPKAKIKPFSRELDRVINATAANMRQKKKALQKKKDREQLWKTAWMKWKEDKVNDKQEEQLKIPV